MVLLNGTFSDGAYYPGMGMSGAFLGLGKIRWSIISDVWLTFLSSRCRRAFGCCTLVVQGPGSLFISRSFSIVDDLSRTPLDRPMTIAGGLLPTSPITQKHMLIQ